MEFIFGIFTIMFLAIIWFIPVIAIAVSNRTSGGEKAAWLLAMIFVSWFAWVFYLLLAPLKERHSY